MAILELRNVSAGYGKNIILKDFCISIEEGKLVSLLGSSGCGKTTTLRTMAGFIDVIQGQFFFDGQDYTHTPIHKRGFGYVFQSYSLIPQYTVYQNIELALIIAKSKLSGKDKQNRIKECTKLVGIETLLRKKTGNLSGGEKQRCAIARAIVNDPEVILADEPTGALDVKTGEEVLELFRNLNKAGKTVVIVTHNAAFSEYADRVIELSDGKIIRNEKV